MKFSKITGIKSQKEQFAQKIISVHAEPSFSPANNKRNNNQEQRIKTIMKKYEEFEKMVAHLDKLEQADKYRYRNNAMTLRARFLQVYKELPKGSVWDDAFIINSMNITKAQLNGIKQGKRIITIFRRDQRAAAREGLRYGQYYKAA